SKRAHGFGKQDFPDPIIEVNQFGVKMWYDIEIQYMAMPFESLKFPGEIVMGRRVYRPTHTNDFRYPVFPFPQLENIYKEIKQIQSVRVDRIIPVKLPGDP
ncbi:MAG: hypothetical protein RLZZ338_1763, partial [Cyanobacteriota bacterium]